MSFLSLNKRKSLSPKDYQRVGDEETKQLDDFNDGNAIAQDLQTTNEALQRTNLYLKALAGFLTASLLLWAVFNLRHVVKKYGNGSRLIESPVPPISVEEVIFKENPIYAARPDPESNRAWDKLLPPGRGFVYVPSWEDYALPPGEETPYGMIYSVALFHQMHCLGQLRRFTWMFLDAIVKNDTEMSDKIRHMFTELDHTDHLSHCFDYLRQTIACGGDMSLEWPRTEPDGKRFAVDGWNIPHECKNWEQIMEYMDMNHFNMSGVDQIAPIGGSSGG